MDSYNQNERREMIMDYYMNPKRKKPIDFDIKNTNTFYHHSTNCVDEITLIKPKKENDYYYTAIGCAIFLASTEIFLETAALNKFSNMDILANNFKKLINQEDISESELISLGKLKIFFNVKKHLNRVECALMITKVIEKIQSKI